MMKEPKDLPLTKVLLVLLFSLNLASGGPQVELNEQQPDSDKSVSNREKKQFGFLGNLGVGLFSVIQFSNTPCQSTSRLASGPPRQGICYTEDECDEKGGNKHGPCAAGFGICCVFTVTSSNSDVRQNCSYLQNPEFPSPYKDTASIAYTVRKISSDICYLRLDFEMFTLLGVGATVDASPSNEVNECKDQFQVDTSSGQMIPVICGENAGQHMYVNLGDLPTDSATLSFTFGESSSKNWEIKVTQYECESENVPPDGCLQYHTGHHGRIKSFNFDMKNDNHLPNQDYQICIRPENGYCCVEYNVCEDEEFGFSLSTTMNAQRDDNCVTEDHVYIPSSSCTCSQASGEQTTGYYCGTRFSDMADSENNAPICRCSTPFTLSIKTNSLADDQDTEPTRVSQGVCLDFTQRPC